jgi:HEAT repeat protein
LITFSCPTCNKKLKVASAAPGTKVKCPGCATAIAVPEADDVVEEATAVVAGTPPAKKTSAVQEKTTKAVVAKVDAASKKTTPPPKGRTKPSRDEDDEDDEDEAPSRTGLWIGLGAGAAALAIGAVILVLALGGDKDTTTKVVKNTDDTPKPRRTSPPPRVTPLVKAATPEDDETRRQEAELQKLFAQSIEAPKRPEIRDHLLKSSALVRVVAKGEAGWGSGSLVDRQNRLILTNYHVMSTIDQFSIVFPVHAKNGELLVNKDDYFDNQLKPKVETYNGKLLHKDSHRDLALIQLDRLPSDVQTIPLGVKSVKGADTVYSMGNAGASGGLWKFTVGTVNNEVFKKKYRTGGLDGSFEINARIVETDSPINPGDSGGALVNDYGELVGVTQGQNIYAKGVSLFIDVQEARNFIQETCKSHNISWLNDGQRLGAKIDVTVQDLIRYLQQTGNPKARTKALDLLVKMGSTAQPAVKALVEVLKDDDEPTNRQAKKALENIGAPDKMDLDFLKTALKDSNERVRIYAAEAIGKLGTAARLAAPDLTRAVGDKVAQVRQNAARSLGQLGPAAKAESVPALTNALKDDERPVRLAASEAIIEALTPVTAADLSLLRDHLLNHKDIEARVAAVRALGQLSSEATQVVGLLKDLCKSSTEKPLRHAALVSLSNLGAASEPALALFIEGVKDMDVEIRQAACLALSKLGAKAKAAVPVLRNALKDSDQATRVNLIIALGGIGVADKETAAELGRLLDEEKDKAVRLEIVIALGKFGSGARPAAYQMIQAFADEELEKAIALLGKIDDLLRDPVSKFKIELALTQILEKLDKNFQAKNVETLSKIGRPAVPLLMQGLDNQSAFVRWGCVKALARMGPAAKDAAVILARNARIEPIPDIRNEAKAAAQRVAAKR